MSEANPDDLGFEDDDYEKLDPDSREIALALFTARPAWKRRAFCDTEEEEDQAHLVLQFLAKDEAGFDLELSTYGGELTLSTRFWHEHSSMLGEPDLESEELDLEPTFELIDLLLGDRARVWSTFTAGEWQDSGVARTDADLVGVESSLKPNQCLWIRSHSGLASRWAGKGPRPD